MRGGIWAVVYGHIDARLSLPESWNQRGMGWILIQDIRLLDQTNGTDADGEDSAMSDITVWM